MADREKVVKGLEYHLKELSAGKTCFECPYWGDNPCEIQLVADALTLLKEQEPVCVMGPDIYEEYWAREAICPDCGTHWMSFDKNGQRVTKYCPGCGRQVKWNDRPI